MENREPIVQKILIVDDEQSNVDYMSRQLTNFFECEVVAFLDPTEALVWSKINDFDLGLFDYRMPDLSGVDLVKAIRSQSRHHSVPLVIITADDNKAIIPSAFDAGASDYLTKPFDRSEFAARVRNLLHLRKTTLQLEDDNQSLEQHIEQATAKLQESEQRFRLAVEGTRDGVWDWNIKTGEIFYSANWCEMLGYQKDDVAPFPAFWMGRVHPDDLYILTAAIDNHISGKSDAIDCEYRIRHRKDYMIWVHTKGKAVRDARGVAVRMVGAQTDISSLKEAQAQLAHSALHDILTGLPNRSLFNERLNQAFLRYKRNVSDKFAVLFIDLDKFKEINDTYGHASGDKVLTVVTGILEKCTREVDTVARIGGDEFVILLEQTGTEDEAKIYVNRLYQETKTPVHLAGRDIKISLSVGAAFVDETHDSSDVVLKEADVALYQAKEQGRDRAVFFKDDMGGCSPRRREMIASMGNALVNNEIEIYYQPIVSLETQEHIGYEALLRWHHPTMGTISPEDFIPIAEKDDTIVRLGTYVMKGAMAQLTKWQAKYQNPDLFMCINVTSAQIFQKGFFELLQTSCAQEGLDSDKIVLEFSEIGFAEIYKWDCSILNEIKVAGFHIALDDYGEGRASLRSLVDYQMDWLKIDRSLSLEMLTDERKRCLFDLMVHLGAESGLQIVVEGIETAPILEYVKRSQAHMGQGFLYSRPCPPKEIEALLKKDKQKIA